MSLNTITSFLLLLLSLFASSSAYALTPGNQTNFQIISPPTVAQIKKTTLIVGSEQDFPPFATGVTDNTAGGFTVELWKEVAAEANLNYIIRVRPFHQLLEDFKAGKIDVLINLATSEQRAVFADFTVPHVVVNGAIFVRKGETSIRSENDFAGKSIIVLSADLAYDYALSKGWKKQLVLVNTAEEGLGLLASGKHDAMLISKLTGIQTIQLMGLENIKALKTKVGFSQKFAFAVQKGHADLLHKISEGLAVIKANGVYNTIYEKWFGIYDLNPITFIDLIEYLIPILLIFISILAYSLNLTKRENEDKKALFLMTPIATVVIDNNAKVSDVNPAFGKMFNTNESKHIGITEIELDRFIQAKCISDDSYLATSNLPIIADLKAKQTVVSINKDELTFTIQSDGIKVIERSYVDCNITRISRIIHFQDITEKSHIDRMKSEFIATAAHELRTPMTSIFGYAELLKKMEFDAETQKKMIKIINEQSKTMIHLLDDLLNMAKIEAKETNLYNMTQQPIGPILKTVIDTFTTPDNHNKVMFEISPNLPEINVDKIKIEQAIKNCLSNAYKFSPNNSEINMYVSEVMSEGMPYISIAIQDHGIGMTPEQLKRVYERFYRADQSGAVPGAGLGMSIMKEIIIYHGGSIEIESQYGVGTKVMMYLPVAY